MNEEHRGSEVVACKKHKNRIYSKISTAYENEKIRLKVRKCDERHVHCIHTQHAFQSVNPTKSGMKTNENVTKTE